MFKKPQRGRVSFEKKKKICVCVCRQGKRGRGGITTHQNIPQRAKYLKNCCGKALERYYGPPGKENRQRFTPLIWDFLLPQLSFILRDLFSPRASKWRKKEVKAELRRWEGEDEVPPSSQYWYLTLKRHQPAWSIIHHVSRQLASHPAHSRPPTSLCIHRSLTV